MLALCSCIAAVTLAAKRLPTTVRTSGLVVACAPATTPQSSDVTELLELFQSLPLARHDEQVAAAAAARSSSDDLSIDGIAQSSKRLLAQPVTHIVRQQQMAAISDEALLAGRPRSARLVYELAARRVSKWRATNPSVIVAPELVRAGMLATVAVRDQKAYERVLRAAQDEWDVPLTCAAPPSHLSCTNPRPRPLPLRHACTPHACGRAQS